MKFNSSKIFDQAYQLTLIVLKCSGFVFFSIETTKANKSLKFKRTKFDSILFILSFSFSIFAYFNVGGRSINANLKAAILGYGTIFVFKMVLLSVVYSKCYIFVNAKEIFGIVEGMKQIETKVKLLSFKTCSEHSVFIIDENNQDG